MPSDDADIITLLIEKEGGHKSFVRANLKGRRLSEARLVGADLTEADISGADLRGADLTGANLTKAQAIGADFTGATLTGACLEDWNISHTTKLEDVLCEYVYLLKDEKERRPNSSFFQAGEFGKLFGKSFGTIDFIFRGSIDWDAFVEAFAKLKVECDGVELKVQGIEDKGDGTFIVRVTVPEGADKERIHGTFCRYYDKLYKLNERYLHLFLEVKDEEIDLERRYNTDMKGVVNALLLRQDAGLSQHTEIKQSIRPGKPIELGKSIKPIKLFISYTRKDKGLLEELENHLSMLKRRRVIETWYDRDIDAGDEWRGEIDEHLNTSDIILLLVSSDFLASDYCYDLEMKRSLERHNAGEACVIPVILRRVDWRDAPFGKLQALPENGLPVKSWNDVDEALFSVAAGIRRVVEGLLPTL